MTHQRTVIRQAVVALLLAAGTDAGSRVFDTPNDPRTAFPAIVVLDGAETQQATTLSFGSRTIERTYSLEVRVEVQQLAGYAAQRDALLAQVEAALADALLPGVKSIVPTHYVPEEDHNGERPIVLGRQSFDVLYYTPQDRPDTTL